MEEDQQESDANATKQASRALLRASEPPQTVQTVREGSAEAARSSPPPPAQRPQLPPPPALRLPSLSKRLSLSKAPVTHSLKHYQSSPPSIYKESWDDSSRYKASSSAPKPGGLLVSYNATFMDQKKSLHESSSFTVWHQPLKEKGLPEATRQLGQVHQKYLQQRITNGHSLLQLSLHKDPRPFALSRKGRRRHLSVSSHPSFGGAKMLTRGHRPQQTLSSSTLADKSKFRKKCSNRLKPLHPSWARLTNSLSAWNPREGQQ